MHTDDKVNKFYIAYTVQAISSLGNSNNIRNVQPFNCEFCHKEFRRKYDRNRHVKYVHLKPLAKIELKDGAPVSTDALFQLTEAGMSLKMESTKFPVIETPKPSAVESEFSGNGFY